MKTYDITSAHNDTFKIFKSLLGSKGIIEHRQAFIFGRKAIEDTLRHGASNTLGLILPETPNETRENLLANDFENIYRLKESLFKELDTFGSGHPILLVKVPEFLPFSQRAKNDDDKKKCYLYLPFQDPGNMGAVLRSAAAFGVNGIILATGASHPFHPRSSRAASAGLFFHSYFKSTQTELKELGLPLVGLEKGGELLSKFKFPKKFILVPGAEGPGLSQNDLDLDFKVGISIKEEVDSLNAPVATSIALYEWASTLGSP